LSPLLLPPPEWLLLSAAALLPPPEWLQLPPLLLPPPSGMATAAF
jgi:hypothetical protein